MEGNGRGGRKGKEGDRWREGFGPPKNFGVAPPMNSMVAFFLHFTSKFKKMFSGEGLCTPPPVGAQPPGYSTTIFKRI